MHGSMRKRRDQEEGGKLLNNPSTEPGIDRGFELMIRDKKRRVQPKTFQLRFGNMFALFNREWRLTFDLSFDIKKKT